VESSLRQIWLHAVVRKPRKSAANWARPTNEYYCTINCLCIGWGAFNHSRKELIFWPSHLGCVWIALIPSEIPSFWSAGDGLRRIRADGAPLGPCSNSNLQPSGYERGVVSENPVFMGLSAFIPTVLFTFVHAVSLVNHWSGRPQRKPLPGQ
jgi:hypothetical protein